MNSRFTNGLPWKATDKDMKARWGLNGNGFRCGLCGYKFKEGDTVRWQYAGSARMTNFFVCQDCDGEPEDLFARRSAMFDELNRLSRILMYEEVA